MEKRVHYFVSRKNVFTWLAVLCMIASCVTRGIYAGMTSQEPRFWLVVVPILACILFVLIILINGEELLFRTALPVFMIALYFIIRTCGGPYTLKIKFLYAVVYAAVAIFYMEVVSGKIGHRIFIGLVFLGASGLEIWNVVQNFRIGAEMPIRSQMHDLFLFLAGFFIICAMDIHLDGKFHPSWGDRPDGRRIRTAGIITQVSAYIMATRQDASNHIHDSVEISGIEKYIQEKKAEGYKNMGFMHVFLATYVRAVAKYPGINRFIAGQKIYSRGNDIQFCMVVKNSMSLEGEESCLKLHLSPYDTIYDIYEKLDAEIERIKKNPVGESDFDKVAKLFTLVPSVLMSFIVVILRTLDYFGMLPKFLLEVSPFHSSIFFTSMASLGINPIVHHLYNFGNMPVFCSFGSKYTKNEIDKDGNIERKKYIDYTFNTDERIVDGFYYASVFKYIKKLLNHPEKLEVVPSEVAKDIE
ncbi:MAG: hypothetical protein MJ059_06240 [Lachnospiraceae bacterium]|nr:hypothetical protein [Lachnospiraceae bacterium]